MINILLMLSLVIYGNYIKAQYFNGEELEISENYDCICDNITLEQIDCSNDYDINNDENTDVLDVVHLVDEIIN